MHISSFVNKTTYSGPTSFTKLNPFTHENLHTVQACDLMGLITAIQAANKSFGDWKDSTKEQRKAAVFAMLQKLESNVEEFSKLEALDQGLPLWFVKEYSLEASLALIKDLLHETENASSGRSPTTEAQLTPVGVVAVVASWNLSLKIILQRLTPAVLAGNSVIVKVSSQSPATAIILSLILGDLPVQVLVTDDNEVKSALIAHPGIKAVSFVGRVESAADVIKAAAQSSLQNYKKIQVSSGSKNSAIMLGEPLDEIFSEVMQSFFIGQGQLAWNSSRLFVLEKYEPAWQERIQQFLADIKPSEGIEDSSLWTPTLRRSSFEKFSEIKSQASEDQAKLFESAFQLNLRQANTHLPIVFTKDMSRCSTLQQDQIHAPFFILSAVKYPFDVAKYSNVSYFGYAAHLWGDVEKLEKVAVDLDVGLITYNDWSVAALGAVPARKQSGYGLQDFSPSGAFFSNSKSIF